MPHFHVPFHLFKVNCSVPFIKFNIAVTGTNNELKPAIYLNSLHCQISHRCLDFIARYKLICSSFNFSKFLKLFL